MTTRLVYEVHIYINLYNVRLGAVFIRQVTTRIFVSRWSRLREFLSVNHSRFNNLWRRRSRNRYLPTIIIS